jgi:hypothetical protein
MTDRRDIEPEAHPEIQRDQEMHPPRRHDDPEAVVGEEERFGMAVPLVTLIIGAVFLIVIALYWLT